MFSAFENPTRAVNTSKQVNSPNARPRILLAEDDDEMRSLLVCWLRNAGYEVTACVDGVELLNHITGFLEERKLLPFGLILSDIRMPWVTGMELLQGLSEYIGFPPVVLMTAFGDRATHESAKRLGAAAVFDKPFDMRELIATVNRLIKRRDFPE